MIKNAISIISDLICNEANFTVLDSLIAGEKNENKCIECLYIKYKTIKNIKYAKQVSTYSIISSWSSSKVIKTKLQYNNKNNIVCNEASNCDLISLDKEKK